MNALDALKLAKETGVKVRPKGGTEKWHYKDDAFTGKVRAFLICDFEGGGSTCTLSAEQLIDASGNPIEWEIAS